MSGAAVQGRVKGGGEGDKKGEERVAVAPLYFMWKSYSAGVYEQLLPLQDLQAPITHTHTHTQWAQCYLEK